MACRALIIFLGMPGGPGVHGGTGGGEPQRESQSRRKSRKAAKRAAKTALSAALWLFLRLCGFFCSSAALSAALRLFLRLCGYIFGIEDSLAPLGVLGNPAKKWPMIQIPTDLSYFSNVSQKACKNPRGKLEIRGPRPKVMP